MMRKAIARLASGLGAVFFIGCGGFLHPAAEQWVSLRGRIANASADTMCFLQLYSDKGEPRGRMPIAPEFDTTMVVAPGTRHYYVQVSCPQASGSFRSPTFSLGGGSRARDVGVITLR